MWAHSIMWRNIIHLIMSGPKGPESGDDGLCSIIPRSEIVHIPGIGEMTIHIETLFPVTDRPDKVAIEVVRTGESGLVRWSTGRYVSVDNDPFACFFPLDPSVMDHYDHVELGMLLPALQ